jgi:predicted phosphodiesterase
MAQYPYTLLLAGHTHTFDYSPSQRQVIIGNGGAPLSGSSNYGFALVERQADGSILVAARDYQTGEPFQSFAVKADGTPAP